jgi:hypothetical protein
MFRPEMLVGAASPLWAYFAGAAVMGSAWWWMTRWLQPANLEALAEAAFEPAVEALAEAIGGPVAVALVDDKDPAFPVGGESAPVSTAVLEAELSSDPSLAADLAQPPEPVLAPSQAAPQVHMETPLAPVLAPVLAEEPAVIPAAAAAPDPETEIEPDQQPPPPKRKAREATPKPH